MKQIIVSLIVLLVLGVAAWFLVFEKQSGTIPLREKAFAYEDTSRIHKIFIADLGDREIILERSGSIWTVNGKYPARPDAMSTLLRTISQMRVKYPVPKSKFNTVVREISGKHVKVELYDEKEKKLRSYFVGAPTQNDRGNFMMLENSTSPYVVVLPGWDGFLQTRFILDETDWRDRTIFRHPVQIIDELKVEYPFNPDSSFTLTRSGDFFDLDAGFIDSAQSVNQRATYVYLNNYKFLAAEYFVTGLAEKDSIITSTPICRISITDDQGTQQVLNLFFRPVNKRTKTQFDVFGNPLENSRDKYYAAFNGNRDFGIVQDFVFGKLFIGPSYFVQPEPLQGSS